MKVATHLSRLTRCSCFAVLACGILPAHCAFASSSTILGTWNLVPSPTTNSINGIAASAEKWVAVAGHLRTSGSILVASDDNEWTEIVDPTWPELNSVAYGNGVFVAVGYDGVILASNDTESWTKQTFPSSNAILWRVTFARGRFVAVGGGASIVSDDGWNWEEMPVQSFGYEMVSEANGYFYRKGVHMTLLERSLDGVSWVPADEGLSWVEGGATYGANARGVSYGDDGMYVLATPSTTFSSGNGTNWSRIDHAGGNSIAHANSVFVVPSTGHIRVSFNGRHWEEHLLADGSVRLKDAAYRNGRFTVVGDAGTILQSGPVQWTYETWAENVLAPYTPGMRCFDCDAFGNGMPNAFDFTFLRGVDGVRGPFRMELQEDGVPAIAFTMRSGISGIGTQLMVSEDLVGWAPYGLEDLSHEMVPSLHGTDVIVRPPNDMGDQFFTQMNVFLQ